MEDLINMFNFQVLPSSIAQNVASLSASVNSTKGTVSTAPPPVAHVQPWPAPSTISSQQTGVVAGSSGISVVITPGVSSGNVTHSIFDLQLIYLILYY